MIRRFPYNRFETFVEYYHSTEKNLAAGLMADLSLSGPFMP